MEQRFYNDIKNIFNDQSIKDNPLIYEFDNTIPNNNDCELLYGITTIYPGKIGDEFYMTRGHAHQNNTAEVYYCISGKGIIVQQYKCDIFTTEISDGSLVYIKPKFLHRAINTGDTELKLLCVCRADSGHDYDVSFTTQCEDSSHFINYNVQKPDKDRLIQIMYKTDDGNNLISEFVHYKNEDSLYLANGLSSNVYWTYRELDAEK